jgi:alpha-L-fucosidase
MNRREFTRLALAGLGMQAIPLVAGETGHYAKANTGWLAKCRYGIGVHWTAQAAPRHGDPLPFQQVVDGFKLKEFVEQVRYAGADYVLFTAAHALQMLPAPHPIIERLLRGRTCERDLIAELADALAACGLSLLVYYNHSCNCGQDRPWENAVGYHGRNKEAFAKNLMDIVGWMGERYKDKIKAWWFDSPYSLDPRGPHNSVTTDMTGFQFPWERFTVAAKAGYPARLVTYNAGVAKTFLYTTHQDYWAGELVNLKTPAPSRYLDNGLQWFGWTCIEDRAWVHHRVNTEIPKPLYSDAEVISYVRACNSHQAPMTFNVGIYQDGTMAEASVEQLHRLGAALPSREGK